MRTTFFFQKFIRLLSAIAILIMNIGITYAQDVSDKHLVSAKKMMSAIHATDQFDSFLPMAVRDLKDKLIGDDPNLEKDISELIDKQALALVKRRADLEKEIAHIYAKHFSQEELDKIAAFYSSDVGKKFLTEVPGIAREAYSVFDSWCSNVVQDLIKNVEQEISQTLNLNNSITPTMPASSKSPT
ncbi:MULTISPECIES: DUF2059 domain-containing protein [unclassified Bartonella]|uniref:DUF2059 domain-containing protein n=1 Tax=unclassified Bartonella TaxID=2645622 RepID=UPI00099A02FB|nr:MULTISPECIES: DUF2059 domain-containing protein [unclassified Bartonella]AQX28113.1 hypothetical protein BJB15x_007150 [Bartonella sp. JB15]AQX29385.1 hypothetical protein BJB63x_007050 [Bartonella sp. JB63]